MSVAKDRSVPFTRGHKHGDITYWETRYICHQFAKDGLTTKAGTWIGAMSRRLAGNRFGIEHGGLDFIQGSKTAGHVKFTVMSTKVYT